jgi:hypothetical protein
VDLGLFVEAEHHGPLGWVEVQPDDVDQLLLEVGIVPHLEAIGASWPQVVIWQMRATVSFPIP